MSAVLLPCPFCGGRNTGAEEWASATDSGPGCGDCGALADSIEKWNTRVPAPVVQGAPKVYLSGPMTGIADLNAPAFAAEAARLLALGYQVENPADVVLPDGATWADFMRADIPRLLACTHIRMLDGWTMSKGARLEHHIAISLGLEVLTDCDLQEQK